jgi:uncharacterized protein involved in outer membrane biogenesis
MTRRRRWVWRALAAVVFLAAASNSFSLWLRTQRAHRYLASRLEAAFGRPVEVGHFAFRLFDGPRIEAEPITVTEDPRFGQEYFLRAERMTAGIRWRRLFLGHFEFGTLSFQRPSLNLVRSSDGRWNIENWLPPPSSGLSQKQDAANRATPARLYKIAVDGGRINFKRGADKQPFALVAVSGTMEQESTGHWRLELAAQPMRAGVVLQEAGTLRLRGSIAGTTTRLQPADLQLTWEGASLADVLRLAKGKDYGVRGRLALELTARSQRPSWFGWSFSLSARGSQLHRWDMTELPRDPAVNLKAEARWMPGEARMAVSSLLLESTGSRIHGSGEVIWPAEIRPEVDFDSAEISLADLLECYRAFHPGVADGLGAEGTLRASFSGRDWPMHFERGELSSYGATLSVPGLEGPVHLGKVTAGLRREMLEFDSLLVPLPQGGRPEEPKLTPIAQEKKSKERKRGPSLGTNQLALGGSVSLREKSGEVTLDGLASHAEDLLTVAAAFGHPTSSRWKLEGSAELHLRWQLSFSPWSAAMAGSTDLRGARVWITGLNSPVEVSGAHIEWAGSGPRVTLSGARALGAQWQGTLMQQKNGPADLFSAWRFRLSADHIAATELDRWLGPRARPSFFDRLFPSAVNSGGAPQNPATGESPLKSLSASGQIAIETLAMEPLRLHKLTASVELESQALRVYDAQSEFYGGKLSGVLEAKLGAQPEYRVDANFDRANLGTLTAATAKLKDHFGGIASGEIHLTARGIGRENLVKSLEGRGAVTVRNAVFRGLDVKAALARGTFHAGATQWASAEAAFTVGEGRIELGQMRLDDHANPVQVEGAIQFSHAWDLRLRSLNPAKERGKAAADTRAARLTGTVEAPQVVSLEAPPGAH